MSIIGHCVRSGTRLVGGFGSRGYRRPLDVEGMEVFSLGQDDTKVKANDTSEDIQTENRAPYMSKRPQTGPQERCINSVTLLGRVGTDPQIRGTDEKPITTFSLATNSTWKTVDPGPGDDEWTHRVDWHNVAVFRPYLREQAYNYVVKGSRVHISGRLLYGEVTDKSGIKRHTTTIAAEDIIYLDRKK